MIDAALPADAIAIDRLRLRVPPGGEAGARRVLEQAPWPRIPDQTWVLVRSLAVRAPLAAIGRRVAADLAALERAAVPAGDPAAEQAAAVRFADLAELIAHLCADLAAGRAPSRWYWQRWRGLLGFTAAAALGEVLGAQAALLPSITARLAQMGALVPVWSTLSPSQALMLQARLAHETGLSLPPPPKVPTTPPESAGSPNRPALTPSLPRTLLRRWAPALAGRDLHDPRCWLAACLVALEWRPGWSGSVTVLGALVVQLTTPETPPPEPMVWRPRRAGAVAAANPAAMDAAGTPTGPEVPGERRAWSQQQATAVTGRAAGPRSPTRPGWPPLGPPLRLGAGERATAPNTGSGSGGMSSPGSEARDSIPAPPGTQTAITGAVPSPAEGPESASPLTPEDPGPAAAKVPATPTAERDASPAWDLETRHGGLFYLINFLARPEAQTLLKAAADRSPDPWPEGWYWLWDLGRRLGLPPAGVLARFLADRLGLADPADIAELPPLPEGAALMNLGARIYATHDLWQPNLLAVPARVCHTPSHLDCHYPLAAVRLPVRQVGLDLNPGWVPWLGRVVTLHYNAPDDRGRPG